MWIANFRFFIVVMFSVISITSLSPRQSVADALLILSNEPATKYDIGVINIKLALKNIEAQDKWPSEMMLGDTMIKENDLHIFLQAFGETEAANINKCKSAINLIRRAAAVDPTSGNLYPPYNALGRSAFADMFAGTGYIPKNVSIALKSVDDQIVITCMMISPDKGLKNVVGKLVSKYFQIVGDI